MASLQEKWIGCFRTCCLSHVLEMFRGYKATYPETYGKVDIMRLTAFRGKELHKDTIRPFPYFHLTNISQKEAKLEYDWNRHGPVDINGVLRTLGESGVQEMVVENTSFLLPKDWVLDEKELKTEKRKAKFLDRATGCVATFEATFIEAWMDGQLRQKVEEVMGDEIRDYRFKHTVLDLVGIADSAAWLRGIKNEFNDLETNSRRLRLVLRQLDPDGDLGYLRQYRLEEGRYWRLVRIASAREW